MTAIIGLSFAVFLAFLTEAVTGFGSIVLALCLGALFLEMNQLVAILVPLSLLISIPLSIRLWSNANKQLLLRTIAPLMTIGLLIGLLIKPYLADQALKLSFGVLIFWFSVRALIKGQTHRLSKTAGAVFIASAGVTHGLFASGGPLLVYALSGAGMDKTQFRATLMPVWASLNIALTVYFWQGGILQLYGAQIAQLAPAALLGLLVGSALHHRISEDRFKPLVFGLLMVISVVLVANTLRGMLA